MKILVFLWLLVSLCAEPTAGEVNQVDFKEGDGIGQDDLDMPHAQAVGESNNGTRKLSGAKVGTQTTRTKLHIARKPLKHFKKNKKKFGRCQGGEGACNVEVNCKGKKLDCMQGTDTGIPGCSGVARSSYSYCYSDKKAAAAADPLYACQGHCNNDSDCEADSQCFTPEDGHVPGCSGAAKKKVKYCVKSSLLLIDDSSKLKVVRKPLKFTLKRKETFGLCQGTRGRCGGKEVNCKDDKLSCMESSGGDYVPGCTGTTPVGSSSFSSAFCFDPDKIETMEDLLFACQGSCDQDSDCAVDLLCFQPHKKGNVPGCSGIVKKNVKYCVESSLISEGTMPSAPSKGSMAETRTTEGTMPSAPSAASKGSMGTGWSTTEGSMPSAPSKGSRKFSGPTSPSSFSVPTGPSIWSGKGPSSFSGPSGPTAPTKKSASGPSAPSRFSSRSRPTIWSYSGPSAPSRFSGPTGPTTWSGKGPSMFSGPTGPSIWSGKGPSMFSGPSAPSGFSGPTGPSIWSGKGPSMFSGPSAPSGFSGPTGPSIWSGKGPSIFSGGLPGITLELAHHIVIGGGTSEGKTYLSTRANGYVDLNSEDDESGRQQWRFELIPGTNEFNILVEGGTDDGEKYLSFRTDGFVDLYSHDDESGRQRWVLEAVPNTDPVLFNVKVAGGTNSGEKYLSVRSDGFVDLYSHDDGSGRQRWRIDDISPDIPDIDLTVGHNLLIGGGTNAGGTYLSCRADGHVDLYDRDDNSGRQKWRFELIPFTNQFHILVLGGTNAGEKYLSRTSSGLVDLYSHDDESGRQRWTFEAVPNTDLYNIKAAGGTDAGETYLSVGYDGLVHLYSHDDGSGGQRWKVNDLDPLPPAIAEFDLNVGHHLLIGGGTSAGETYLSCRTDGYIEMHDRDDNSGRQKWRFELIPGTNEFHILVLGGTNAGEEYLTSTETGDVDLYSHDDESGRQRWIFEAVPNTTPVLYNIMVAGGTDTGETYLSATQIGLVHLYSHDDGSGRQRWKVDDLDPLPPAIPEFDLNAAHNLKISGGTPAGDTYLSCRPDGFVDLYSHDEASGRQRWRFEMIPGTNAFNIMVDGGTNAGEEYLSSTTMGLVDLVSADDESGKQRWVFKAVLNSAPVLYNIQVVGGSGSTYLSGTQSGLVELTGHDDGSGRQRWSVLDPYRP